VTRSNDGHKCITPLFFTISSILWIARTIGLPPSASEVGYEVPVFHRALYEGSKGRTRAAKSLYTSSQLYLGLRTVSFTF
jgi:hypothetical protein